MLPRLLHTELHWLDVPELVVMVFNCLHGTSRNCANMSQVSGVEHFPRTDISPLGQSPSWTSPSASLSRTFPPPGLFPLPDVAVVYMSKVSVCYY